MSKFRVAIIGSGVAGASTAYALTKMGAEVSIIEAELEGKATAAGAGIIQPWSSAVDGPFYDLYAAGAAYYSTLVEQLADDGVQDIDYRIAGSLVVNANEKILDDAEQRVRRRTEHVTDAGTISRLTPAEAQAIFPPLANGMSGLHISGGARVDGRTLRHGLLTAAEANGATRIVGRARLEVGGADRPPRLTVGPAEIIADAIVVAAGVWTNHVLAPVGRSVGISPQRGQITHLRVEADTSNWPSVLPLNDHYLVAFDDSRIVVGATREAGTGFDPRVTAEGQRQVLDAALSVAPGLAEATFIETRVGLRPIAEGTLPQLGPVAGISGLFVNAGFGAAGLTMGPYAGQLLAAQIMGKAAPGLLDAFVPKLKATEPV